MDVFLHVIGHRPEGGSYRSHLPVVVGDEEVGVDHLVQERLDKVLPRPQLQKRNRQADGAETLPGTEPEKRKGYNKPAGFSTLCSDLRQY